MARKIDGFELQGWPIDRDKLRGWSDPPHDIFHLGASGQMTVNGIDYTISANIEATYYPGRTSDEGEAQPWRVHPQSLYIRRTPTGGDPTDKARRAIYNALVAIGEAHCADPVLRATVEVEARETAANMAARKMERAQIEAEAARLEYATAEGAYTAAQAALAALAARQG